MIGVLGVLGQGGCGDPAAGPADLFVSDGGGGDLAGGGGGDLAPADLAAGGDLGPVQGPLRIATFNCHCLIDEPARRVQGIARGLAALDVDAVALQEICETDGNDNFARTLARELETATGTPWEHRFTSTHRAWDRWTEGIGLVARKGSITDGGEVPLPKGSGPFPRTVIWARIETPRGAFVLYSLHLIAGDSLWTTRVDQVQAVLALVRQNHAQGGAARGAPAIVAGDYNDQDWTGPLQAMRAGPPAFTDAWAAAHPGMPGYTFDNPSPSGRIDYIFVESARVASWSRVEVIFDQPYQGIWLSDHRGVFATVSTR